MKRHGFLNFIFSILLVLSVIGLSLSVVLNLTIYDEEYIKEELAKSDIVGKGIDERIDKSLSGDVTNYLDVEGIKSNLRQPLKDSIDDIIIVAIYHPSQADAKLSDIKAQIHDTIKSKVTDGNAIIGSLIDGTVNDVTNDLISSVKQQIHYDQVKEFGKMVEKTKDHLKTLLYVSAVVCGLSLIILFIIGRRTSVIVSFVISAIVIALGGLLLKFVPLPNLSNAQEIVLSVSKEVIYYTWIASAISGAAAVVFGIISVIIHKSSSRDY